MTEHFNGLTSAEDERLTLLAEECAEVIIAVAKIQRHGWESRNPEMKVINRRTNKGELAKEIGHVLNAVAMMTEADDFAMQACRLAQAEKRAKIAPWLHHQEKPL